MNFWKEIETRPSPKVVHAVVETPKGSRNEYKYDANKNASQNKDVFVLKRVLYSPNKCPINCGMISQTVVDDKTPLGILVMMHQPTFPGCMIKCRPIGVMKMTEEGKRNDKILSVAVNDLEFRDVNDIQDVTSVLLREIEQFFREYKKLEGRTMEILGWKNRDKAFETIEHAEELYNEMLSLKSLFLLK